MNKFLICGTINSVDTFGCLYEKSKYRLSILRKGENAVIKKTLAIILALVMLTSCIFCIPAYAGDEGDASDSEDSPSYASEDIGDVYSCVYDASAGTVNISGKINHDILITHGSYTISLYRIPFGSTFEEVISSPETSPLATAAISIRFDFSVNVKTVTDIFSLYAAALVSESGEISQVCSPVYPSVKSDYTYTEGDRSDYKGISTFSLSAAENITPSTAIIPVYLEKLINTGSTGYLYTLDGMYIFFDKSYINELDTEIRSLSGTGCRVYLQFMLTAGADTGLSGANSGDGGAKYEMPDMMSAYVQKHIFAFSDYLSDRYSTYESGIISGIIIGRQTDNCGEYNHIAPSAADQYADMCAFYAIIVAIAARVNIPSLDIVIPFSDRNTYSEPRLEPAPGEYDAPGLISGLCRYFDDNFCGNFDFTLLIESSHTPFGITSDNITEGVDTSAHGDSGYISADNIGIFEEYFRGLCNGTPNAPLNFMYVLCVGDNLRGNALSCAYAYSYYRLLTVSGLRSFTVSFADTENNGNRKSVFSVLNILRYIDTSSGFNETYELLEFFDAPNWYAVVENMYKNNLAFHSLLRLDTIQSLPDNITGSFVYFDFASVTGTSSWYGGAYCKELNVDYGSVSGRAMTAHFSMSGSLPGEYGSIVCIYEYPENYIYTPYIEFSLCIDSESDSGSNSPTELYEVRAVIGTDGRSAEFSKIVTAGEKDRLTVNISEYSAFEMVDYIRLSVRCVSSDKSDFTLRVSSLSGYSPDFSSEELESLIAAERLRIRNQSAEDDGSGNSNVLLIVIGVIAVISVCGVALLMILRRDDDQET